VTGHRSKSLRNGPWRLLLCLLCCALVVFGGTVQVAHTHPGGDISHADCAFCATAHVVAQTVSNPAPAPAVLVFAAVREFLPQDRPARISVFALFTRPPPAASTAA
jgi:hypothetical protein